MSTWTPWGYADRAQRLARGITRYDTPSHGGYKLSAGRLATLPDQIKKINPWAGIGWYEEDQDWALVVLSFPQHFDPLACKIALRMLDRQPAYWQIDVPGYLETEQGELCTGKAEEAVIRYW